VAATPAAAPVSLELVDAPRALSKPGGERASALAAVRAALVAAIGAPTAIVVFSVLAKMLGNPVPTLAASIAVLTGGVGFAFLRFRRRFRSLFIHGQAVEGRISMVAHDSTWDSLRVYYTYEHAGKVYGGKYLAREPAELRAAVMGGPILIICDPKRPKRHMAVLVPEGPAND
jgi:hypothetical protein